MECSICYEAITDITGQTTLGCSHNFHFRCIVKWFDSQVDNNLKESCPCCRHEATEHEQLPYDYPMDYEDVEEDNARAGREERAHAKFLWLKAIKSKEELEAYAASKIAAMLRGHWAYRLYCSTRDALLDYRLRKTKLKRSADDFVASKYILRFYRLSTGMTRGELITYAAKKIQKAWRDFYAKRPNLRVSWERTGESWTRVVQIMPASYFYDDPVFWEPTRSALPPQSLAFQMARSATAIQALWRGYSVRNAAIQTPRKRIRAH